MWDGEGTGKYTPVLVRRGSGHSTLARQCGLSGEAWTGGDCHLYLNHLEQADLQLSRTPYPLPELVLKRRPPSLFDYAYEDVEFRNYRHHAAIKAPIAV